MLSRIYSPRKNREDGFTLIELLIVVIIIGVLAAIALPIFLNQQKAANDGSVQSDVRNTVDNIETWRTVTANQNKVETNTGTYVTDGGKPVISKGNTVGVAIASDGSYTVCGYATQGTRFTSASAAYTYDSKSGNFGTGSCASGADTGGAGTGAVVAAAPPVASYDFEDGTVQGWAAGRYNSASVTSSPVHGGKYALLISGDNSPYAASGSAPTMSVVSGYSYTFTAYVNTSGSVYMALNDGTTYQTNTASNTGNKWVALTTTFTANGNTVKFYIFPGSVNATFDDVTLVKN